MRRVARTTAVAVALATLVAGAYPGAAGAVDWSSFERQYRHNYPRFMRIAERRVPYKKPFLRVLYFSGGIGSYYGRGRSITLVCRWARRNVRLFNHAAKRQIFKGPGDYAELRRQHVTLRVALHAYRLGVLLGCSRR
jgi:hypothetical protein